MTDSLDVTCLKAFNYSSDERAANACQENYTDDYCKRYYLDTSTNEVVEITYDDYGDQLYLCDEFETETSSSSVICTSCYSTYTVENVTLTTSNNCDSVENMPFCTEDQRYGSDFVCA